MQGRLVGGVYSRRELNETRSALRPVTEQNARTKCDIETRSTDIEISNGNSDIGLYLGLT